MNPYKNQLCQAVEYVGIQKNICDAFVELYKSKEFDSITIKELCERVPIARTTFYSYFNNTWEVKEMIESHFVLGLLNSSYGLIFFSFDEHYDEYLKRTLQFLNENYELFKLLLVTRSSQSFLKKYKTSIKYHYYQICHGHEASLEIVSGYLISVFTYYLENNISVSNEALEQYSVVLMNLLSTLEKTLHVGVAV